MSEMDDIEKTIMAALQKAYNLGQADERRDLAKRLLSLPNPVENPGGCMFRLIALIGELEAS